MARESLDFCGGHRRRRLSGLGERNGRKGVWASVKSEVAPWELGSLAACVQEARETARHQL